MSSDDQESLSTGLRKPDSTEADVGNPGTSKVDKESMISADVGNPGTSKVDKESMISCHKFETARYTSTPSWFFENCSGALATKIVIKCPHMGNTLMWTSSILRERGIYVITMRQESTKVCHYVVRQVRDEFKLARQNANYTLKTLDEVMDTFVRETGPSITRPMKSNDLKELGVEFDAMKMMTLQDPVDELDIDHIIIGMALRDPVDELDIDQIVIGGQSIGSETAMAMGYSSVMTLRHPVVTAHLDQIITSDVWREVLEQLRDTQESMKLQLKLLSSFGMESARLAAEGGQPSKIAEQKAHEDHGRGAEWEDEQVQPVVSCEGTPVESDESTLDSLEGWLTEEADGTCPVFSMKWQGSFTVPSATGGTFQLQNSEVVLSVPPNAVPIKEAHVQCAICTDIDYIHDRLHLEDEEEIVSPLVEYKMTEPFCFQEPVSIILPHKCFHEKEDSSLIYVYHVFMNENRTLERRRLVNASSLNAEEESSEQDTLPHFLITSDDRIITKTKSFSGYFVCKHCKKNDNKPPNLYAAVGGKFESEETVKVQIRIWDWRLKCEDFRQKLGNDQPWCEPWPLNLLPVILGTQLLVSLKMNECGVLALDRAGNELTPAQQIIELPHKLVCKRCLKKGRFNVLPVEWLLEATGSPVRSAIDVNHCILQESATGDQQQGARTIIPCVITREKRDVGIQAEERDRLTSPDQQYHWRSMLSANLSNQPLPVGGSEARRAVSDSSHYSENGPPYTVQLPPPVNCEEQIDGASRRWGEPSVDLRQQHLYSRQRRDEAVADASRYNPSANGPSHSTARVDIPPDLRLDSLK